jgi:cbb3-type cytochrome oxidase subunit 1
MIMPRQDGQAPPRLSLAFFVTGFVALAGAYAWLALHADAILLHYLLPEGVTLAHLVVLGWLTMVMMGAVYQLISVLVQAPLYSVRLAVIQYLLFAGGAAGLVESFATSRISSLPIHGITAVAGVLLFLINIGLTFRRIRDWSAPARYLAASLGFLALTVSLGFLYALDLRYGWFPVTTHRLALHAHLGIAGWMGLLVTGVSYRLLPMFVLVRGHDERIARWNLGLLSGSLLALAAMLVLDAPRPFIVAPAVALAAGYLVYAWDIARMFRARLRRRLDLYAWHLFLSLGCLVASAVAGVLTATGLPQGWVGEVEWTLAYAYVALGGWLTLAVMGHAYKIVPMLVWQLRYSDRTKTGPAPLLTDMYPHRPAAAGLVLYGAGAATLIGGLLAGNVAAVRLAALVAGLGLALFLGNMAWIILGRHAAAPRRPSTVGANPARAAQGERR